MKVIAISGKAQHGKDTTANMLKKLMEQKGKTVLIFHYADLLKYICRSYFDWDGKKDDAGRRILQYVGTDVIRAKQPDYWVDFATGFLRLFPDEWDYVLIPDCRFPNEVDCLGQAGFDMMHVRIVRPGFKSPLSPEQQMHPSETALDHTVPDHWVYNDGTLGDLENTIAAWIRDCAFFSGLEPPKKGEENETEKIQVNRPDRKNKEKSDKCDPISWAIAWNQQCIYDFPGARSESYRFAKRNEKRRAI